MRLLWRLCPAKTPAKIPQGELASPLRGIFKRGMLYEGKRIHKISIPKGRKTLPAGTYAGIARQLKISIAQFDNLLDCPLALEGYIAILAEKGVVPPKMVVSMDEVNMMLKDLREE